MISGSGLGRKVFFTFYPIYPIYDVQRLIYIYKFVKAIVERCAATLHILLEWLSNLSL
jgi:hypothetical protein